MNKVEKQCVFSGCGRKAVGICNNCRIPICQIHSKRLNNFFICENCYKYLKKYNLLK